MTPELNLEYPTLDNEAVFAKMVELTNGTAKKYSNPVMRANHAKATGCVSATFTVNSDVPERVRFGVFRDAGRTWQAIVRFSNSPETITPDGQGTARGLAIKLKGVEGTRANPGDADSTQDFVMIDHPVFPFGDPKSYVDAMSRLSIPSVGAALVAAHETLKGSNALEILKAIRAKHVASPLDRPYWSVTPYWLGAANGSLGHAVKYSVVPRHIPGPGPADPSKLDADYLGQALRSGLSKVPAVFDFRVQVQTDPVAMPVEDASVEWSEVISWPVSVATLTIGVQTPGLKAGDPLFDECDSASFHPWHALAEHRPMGGMNRLRKMVYDASVKNRRK